MSDSVYFVKPEYGSIDVGSLVWYYNAWSIVGPLHVVEIQTGGYGNGSFKKWVLFDISENAYHTTRYENLRVPKEYTCH